MAKSKQRGAMAGLTPRIRERRRLQREAEPKPTHHGWGAENIPNIQTAKEYEARASRKLQLDVEQDKELVYDDGHPARAHVEAMSKGWTDERAKAMADEINRQSDPVGKYGFRNSPEVESIREQIYRQAPALQVADQILNNFNRDEEQPSLADLFIAATYTEPSNYGGRMRKAMTDVMMRYRLDMQKAHRFVLDDQFVEYATHVASVEPKKLMNRIHAATLPYEQTWLEFDLRKKVETMRKIHRVNDTDMSEIAPRAGLLLQRINDTDMVCTCVTQGENGRVMPHLSSYFFTTREVDFFSKELYHRHHGCIPFNFEYEEDIARRIVHEEGMLIADFREGLKQIGKATLWGYSKNSSGMLPKDGPTNMMVPELLMHHGDAGYSRFYEAVKIGIDLNNRQDFDRLHDLIVSELREFSGMMRWIVTVLAMLNEVPIHTNLVQRTHEMRVDRLRKKKFVDYHKVTLKIPKVRPIPFIERKLSHAEQRRRAHEVRGHWRTYLKEGYCRRDEHEWVWDNENGYRLCGKCMSFSTFIHEHVRGDPSLGWVRKDYHVEKAKV